MYIILTNISEICTTDSTKNVRVFRRTLFQYVSKKFWCQLPEDGEIIALKHVAGVQTIARMLQNSGFAGVT
jgi:hypothetical protein